MNADITGGLMVAAAGALIAADVFLGAPLWGWAADRWDRFQDRRLERKLEKALGFPVQIVEAVDVDKLEVAQVFADWSRAAVPSLAAGEQLVLVDHAECENPDCDQIICCCPARVAAGQPCVGTVFQDCTHHSLLHGACALVECMDCAIDAGALR